MPDEKETLELIGMTKDELRDRVVKSIVNKIMYEEHRSDEGEWEDRSRFARELDKHIKSSIDESVREIADVHVKPVVKEKIENFVLQETNQWGEKKGKIKTFAEYLVERAEHYMVEEVDSRGKSRSESGDGYGFRGVATRISYIIDKHLHYEISSAMKNILDNANNTLADGLQKAVKVRLKEIVEGIKFEVKMPR